MSNLFNIGTRALVASQSAINVTGHNIANAATPGYSRQEVQLSATPGQFSGAGFVGKGVAVSGIDRAFDNFVLREQQRSASQSAMDEARLAQLQKLNDSFELGETGLGQATTAFFNAFVDVAANPADPAARQVVVSRAEEFAGRVRATQDELDTTRQGVASDLGLMTTQANQLIEQIARVNSLIRGAQGAGQAPNDLMDQRDQLITELSALVPVSTVQTDQGGLNVMLPGGQALVLDGSARRLELRSDPDNAALHALTLADTGLILRSGELNGGQVGGLLRFEAEDLPAAQAQFESLVNAFTAAVNRQQQLGQFVAADGSVQRGAALFDDGGLGLGRLQVVMRDPLGVAAAAPVAVAAAATNTGTAVVQGLSVENWDGSTPPAVDLEFTGPAGGVATGYRWRVDGGAWTSEPSLPTPLTLSFPVGGDPSTAPTGWSLQLGGQPRSGDGFSVAPPAGTPTQQAELLRRQNGNALAFVGLRDQGLVGGQTLHDAYASLVADVGMRTQGAETSASLSVAAAERADKAREAVSGVNLDEEAARLIQQQQAYQAAAKILQVAQSLFDTVLGLGR